LFRDRADCIDEVAIEPIGKVESLICAVMRGEAIPWADTDDHAQIARFLSLGRYHGILPLLGESLRGRQGGVTWPAEILKACHDETITQAMSNLARRAELSRVLARFICAGIRPLLLKGTALAYSHYASPAQRPCGDIDLLIRQSQKAEIEETLRGLGYERGTTGTAGLASYQATWSRKDHLGVVHDLDIHWRINNSQILAKLLDYEELESSAVPLPPLGQHALGLGPAHALLFACMHRAGHKNAPYYVDGVAYPGSDRLIWLYDIHLVLSRMSGEELGEFVTMASSKGLKSICLEALNRSATCFNTFIPPYVLQGLAHSSGSEPAARYLSGGPVLQMTGDFIAIDGWDQRALFLKEIVFPSGAYMHAKYAKAKIQWLPLLYVRRFFQGLWKALRS
jgi:hypothetical protein